MTEQEGAALRWRGTPPRLREPVMIAAFSGWPDAGEVASRALRHLIEHLPARKVAEIDPEEFYVFTESRPVSLTVAPGERRLEWPKSEFFAWRNPDPDAGEGGRLGDLVLFLAREPHLRWRAYTANVLTVAMRLGVRLLITLGGTYDSVVHSDDPVISGSASTDELRDRLGRLAIHGSGYQGPSSVQSALQGAFGERGLPAASLWGHAPHYVQGVANTKVAAGLVRSLGRFLSHSFDTAALDAAALSLERRVERVLAQDAELSAYVRQLRERLAAERAGAPGSAGEIDPDAPPGEAGELPEPGTVVEELEEFLRRQRPDAERGEGPEARQ